MFYLQAKEDNGVRAERPVESVRKGMTGRGQACCARGEAPSPSPALVLPDAPLCGPGPHLKLIPSPVLQGQLPERPTSPPPILFTCWWVPLYKNSDMETL